jgi:multidrug efflux pump subunit AcrB
VATLSICIVFAPMFLLSGVAPLAEAVVFAMLASYFLSRTIVPTMAKYLLRGEKMEARDTAVRNPLVRLQKRFDEAFERFHGGYPRLLEICLHHRRVFLITFFAASLGSLVFFVPAFFSVLQGARRHPAQTKPAQ